MDVYADIGHGKEGKTTDEAIKRFSRFIVLKNKGFKNIIVKLDFKRSNSIE